MKAWMLATLTIGPPAGIDRAAPLVTSSGPVRLTASVRFQVLWSTSSTG